MFRYDIQYLKYFRLGQNMRDYSKYSPPFPYLKHLQEIETAYVTITKLSSNEIRETFREGLE